MSSPHAVARDAKFKERFRRRFSTKAQGRISPNPEKERSQTPPEQFNRSEDVAACRSPHSATPRLQTPETPTVFVEEVEDDTTKLPAAPKQLSARDIQMQLDIDTPITADDYHEFRRQQSRARQMRAMSSLGAPSCSSGSSFLSNSKQFVVEQFSFVDASQKSFGSTESVAFQFFRKRIARNALHDSADRFDPPKCDEDTRVGLIEEIMAWIDDPKTPSQIAVITGPAGSGKSAIQQTICEACAARNILAGSFFFSVEDSSRNKHHPLFVTLIYQIAQTNKDLRPFIEQAVKDDPAVFDRSLEAQVNILLIDTFQAASSYHTEHLNKKWPRLLVIDGVDECRGEEMQLHILQVINKCFVQRKLPFKIILASRPEYAIRTALDTYLDSAYHVRLHEHDASSDIKLYFRRRLQAIGAASHDPRASDARLWPTEQILDKLTENASGQFVYAATVIKHASNRRVSPYLRIEQVLAWEPSIEQRKLNPFAALDALYQNILVAAETAYHDDPEDERESVMDLLRELMLYNEASPFVAMSLSIHEFEGFLQLRRGQVLDMLSDLHSLIETAVVDTNGFPELRIVLHHKSFSDYLQDPSRSKDAHQQNYAVYTTLLRYTLTWLRDVDFNSERPHFTTPGVGETFLTPPSALDVICKGTKPASRDDIPEEGLQIARFCVCNWPVYLFKSLMMDVGLVEQSQQTLSNTLADFFASNGWSALKAFVRQEGLFQCTPQNYVYVQTPVLEEIWSWYLGHCVAVGALSTDQVTELNEMISCLQCYRSRPSTGPPAKRRLNCPIMVPRAEDVTPPRCIKLSLPPLTGKPIHEGPEAGDCSSPTHCDDDISPIKDGAIARQEENPGKVPHRASAFLSSPTVESDYYSCSSHFGDVGVELEVIA